MDESEVDFAHLWASLQGDRIPLLVCDTRLAIAASDHAQYLEAHPSSASKHIGSLGSTPNQRVRASGYNLPAWQGNGNTVESVYRAVGDLNNAADVLAALLGSPAHRAHLMGEGGFADNVVYGIGHFGEHWVVLIAFPEDLVL